MSDIEEATKLLVKNVNFESITTSVKTEIANLKKAAEEGNYTWTVLSVIAGGLLTFSGFLGLASSLMYLSPFAFVMNLYIMAFGAVMVTLEYKEKFLTKKYVAMIRTEASFLTRPYGRALFYIFVGVLVVVFGGWLNFFIGIFTTAVGAYVYHSSKEAYAALANVRDSSLNEQEIAAKFQSFDRDASGSLDTAELAKLCQSLGSPLSHNELESALFILDKDGSGVIEYSEFLVWWKGKEY